MAAPRAGSTAVGPLRAAVAATRIEVHGTVQGVGFRPFVYRLATGLGLDGDVCNAGGYVVIRATGQQAALTTFTERLVADAPPLARVRHLVVAELPLPAQLTPGFRVAASGAGHDPARQIPPDVAPCAACLAELGDPRDRRFRYPFTNCVDCGPRATIIGDLPYDRERTAMRRFPLCAACLAEYQDPADRRFHAEPVACPDCGPSLFWYPADAGALAADAALRAAEHAIAAGGVVALKGVGGYQLVCDATCTAAVDRLRSVKARPRKPFAVMVPDLAAARRIAQVGAVAAGLLAGPDRPIVLLRRRLSDVAAAVAPGLAELGVFLPASPLHHLLLTDLDRPLVVTSGNRGDQPIIIDDDEARAVLGPLTDGVLAHDRPIVARYDDSVRRIVTGRPLSVRRARGQAPAPLPLPVPVTEPVLALGAQLKHTATLALGDRAILGPHTGDLGDADTFAAFTDGLARLCTIHDADPRFVAHDLHPRYLSTRHARRWAPARRIAVQHHHAHVAATAAEHGLTGPFIGVAYDGLGLGDDGTLWGGEVLLADYLGYRRLARFGTAPLPGGEAAVRRPARMALGYLFGAEPLGLLDGPGGRPGDTAALELAQNLLERLPAREIDVVRRMVAASVNAPRASSAGRLFDAAAALLGLCDDAGYEGEAAVLLEAAATGHEGAPALEWHLVRREGVWVYDPRPTLRDLLAHQGSGTGLVAARFHTTLTEVTAALVSQVAAETGVRRVCLGGGVFQNRLLAGAVLRQLRECGFEVFAGQEVPPGDGGISYGQAAVAAARLAHGAGGPSGTG
jgi:hydrogenase maturation protein HypF